MFPECNNSVWGHAIREDASCSCWGARQQQRGCRQSAGASNGALLNSSGRRLPSRRQAWRYIWASGKRLKVMLRLKWLSVFICFISLCSSGSCSYNNIFRWKRKHVFSAISGTITKGNRARASSRRPLARLPIHFLGLSLFRFAGRSNFTSLSAHGKTLFLAVINAAYNVHCSRASVCVYARLFLYR